MNQRNQIYNAINDERDRQDKKWGEQNHHPLFWSAILMEELGELSQAIIDEENTDRIKSEAIQVAAVSIAFLEYLERGSK